MTKIVITLDRTMTVKLFRVMQCSRGTGRKIGSILSPIRPSSQEFQEYQMALCQPDMECVSND